MRKFLVEMDYVVTLADMEDEWRDWGDGRTFSQYLAECLSKNGALTEILTEDTPHGEEMHAVTLCRVFYGEDIDDFCDEWLTEAEQREKKSFGYEVWEQRER